MVSHFFQVMQGLGLDLEEEDSWVWKVGKFQTYTVNSSYVSLRRDQEGEKSYAYNKFWRCKALSSALITAWRVWRIRLLLGSIWKGVGLQSKVLSVVCAS